MRDEIEVLTRLDEVEESVRKIKARLQSDVDIDDAITLQIGLRFGEKLIDELKWILGDERKFKTGGFL